MDHGAAASAPRQGKAWVAKLRLERIFGGLFIGDQCDLAGLPGLFPATTMVSVPEGYSSGSAA